MYVTQDMMLSTSCEQEHEEQSNDNQSITNL